MKGSGLYRSLVEDPWGCGLVQGVDRDDKLTDDVTPLQSARPTPAYLCGRHVPLCQLVLWLILLAPREAEVGNLEPCRTCFKLGFNIWASGGWGLPRVDGAGWLQVLIRPRRSSRNTCAWFGHSSVTAEK